jgi:hypothetical protein
MNSFPLTDFDTNIYLIYDLFSDINECSSGSNVCGNNHICKNLDGSYECVVKNDQSESDGDIRYENENDKSPLKCHQGYTIENNECKGKTVIALLVTSETITF